jgi:amino acid adenylation domain-containing protein
MRSTDAPLHTHPLLTTGNNGAFTEFARSDIEQSVPTRFEQQVERFGPRLAVKDGSTELTYSQLNARANRVAHAVASALQGEAAPVALLLNDSIPTITAIVGVLKAGAFYLVLSPADPSPRLHTLIDDARVALMVCDSMTRPLAQALVGDRLPLLDLDATELESRWSDTNLGLEISPDALLNIMYTSGSTGRPKGVLQNHRNLLHTVYATNNRLYQSSNDRMALLSPLGVGVSSVMLFGGLLVGAVVVPFNVRRHGVAQLVRWLATEQITSSYSLPSVIRNALLLLGPGERLTDLRTVKVGGEPLFRSDVSLFREHLPQDCVIQQTLGTTETYAITWTHLDLRHELLTPVVNVGWPEEDRELLIVDDDRQPVPQGEVGEIVVRSRFLSPGYWHQPDATLAAYADAPDGQRDYRTGDLGRLLLDGSLEHLGRKDFLVKIRGHLVSPSEVEVALRELDAVVDAAVIGHAEQAGRRRLVAYVVAAERAWVDGSALRAALATRLADHMVPASYVFVDSLPLLPNGKVNLRALPSPDAVSTSGASQQATTPLESLVLQIWSAVLGRTVEDIHADFAELGGDSLLAAQILARINTACDVSLPFSVLFDAPTVASLARVVGSHMTARVEQAELAELFNELEGMSESEAQRAAQGLA